MVPRRAACSWYSRAVTDSEHSEDDTSPESQRSLRRKRAQERREGRAAEGGASEEGQDAAAKPQGRGYEFRAEHDKVFAALATKMGVVGFLGLAGAVLGVVVMIAMVGDISKMPFGAASVLTWILAVAAVFLAVGMLTALWTLYAARSFRSIVDTRGKDLDHLMSALRDLDKLYALQVLFGALGLLLVLLAMLRGLGGSS